MFFLLTNSTAAPDQTGPLEESYKTGVSLKDRLDEADLEKMHEVFLVSIVIKYESIEKRLLIAILYLGSLVTNQNSIQEEIKCILKARNACYYSFVF